MSLPLDDRETVPVVVVVLVSLAFLFFVGHLFLQFRFLINAKEGSLKRKRSVLQVIPRSSSSGALKRSMTRKFSTKRSDKKYVVSVIPVSVCILPFRLSGLLSDLYSSLCLSFLRFSSHKGPPSSVFWTSSWRVDESARRAKHLREDSHHRLEMHRVSSSCTRYFSCIAEPNRL